MLHKDVSTSNSTKILFALSLAFLLLVLSAIPPLVPSHAASAPYMVKDIIPQGGSNPVYLTALNDKLIFVIPKGKDDKPQLWRSDGTKAGTTHLASFSSLGPFVVTRSRVYFTANDGEHGSEPWRSNGTPDGTQMIDDLKPGKKSSKPLFIGGAGKRAYFLTVPYYQVVNFFGTGGKSIVFLGFIITDPGGVAIQKSLFFAGSFFPSPYNFELWKTDGSLNGTTIVKEIRSSGGSFPNSFTSNGSSFWFFATDDSGQQGLWQSDGTGDGTQLIKELGAPATLGIAASANVQGTLYFVIRNETTQRLELWLSDSTETGTQMVQEIGPASQSPNYPVLAAFGSMLVFAVDDGTHGTQLWKSDGTPEGTEMITSFATSPNALDGNLVVVKSRLFFSANDGIHGFELWQTDGTSQGTGMVADINPDGNSFPRELTGVRGTLFFSAKDGTHGVELWAYKP